MFFEVAESRLEGVHVLLVDVRESHATVVLDGLAGGDHHHRRRPQVRRAVDEIEKLLGAEIGPEPGLGHHVVGQLAGDPRRQDAAGAVGDVGERPRVNERGRVLHRLHEVGQDGLVQDDGHRPRRVQLRRPHGAEIPAVADDDLAQPPLQVRPRRRQREDRHDLGRRRDHEPRLARHAVDATSQPDHGLTQRPVVHVERAAPDRLANVDLQLVAVVDVGVHHRREQVVRGPDGVDVAVEVEVDAVHREDLRVAAACCPTLDAEHRPERRLAEGNHALLAQLPERLSRAQRW